ncbi:MAG: ribosome-associated translation inhibitor RaiA [Tenuifilaceae bacterium]|uniref:ribosome hibernation-promoting factor, HPF/YfiA family n=1 Tax=Perlabentimonas gracilis TaxID=2715279 RepID=UPI00140D8439|nr:ribosome-associated translation inhibitor RaiA [Perlabentimonas gracilis]MDX9769136.1 ribosome-associated translation inhibitor RaiA [Tenuifilaceae bacterium]NHB67576.1 ribosome-associated translation inhibitor RaiA [Perlabentimonas gracilis]
MDVKIQSIKFDADKKLVEFINSKLAKLQRFYDAIIGAEVFLKLENSQDMENKIVEVKLLIPGNDLFVERQAKTFEEGVDDCLEVLKRQVTKHKEKQRGI